MKDAEHKEQCALIKWFDMQYPAYKGRLFAIPNGGHRHIRVAAKLKAEGVRAGVPDLFLPIQAKGFGGLFIELKAKNGRPTEKQLDWLEYLSGEGYLTALCMGSQAAIDTIKSYLGEKNG